MIEFVCCVCVGAPAVEKRLKKAFMNVDMGLLCDTSYLDLLPYNVINKTSHFSVAHCAFQFFSVLTGCGFVVHIGEVKKWK